MCVERLMEVERYSHVMHISSTVTGRLLPGLSSWDALRAALPAGTVSGAPKARATVEVMFCCSTTSFDSACLVLCGLALLILKSSLSGAKCRRNSPQCAEFSFHAGPLSVAGVHQLCNIFAL